MTTARQKLDTLQTHVRNLETTLRSAITILDTTESIDKGTITSQLDVVYTLISNSIPAMSEAIDSLISDFYRDEEWKEFCTNGGYKSAQALIRVLYLVKAHVNLYRDGLLIDDHVPTTSIKTIVEVFKTALGTCTNVLTHFNR